MPSQVAAAAAAETGAGAAAAPALNTLVAQEVPKCQVIIKKGPRKDHACSVRLPCRSHAVTATALAATALGIPAAVSSAAVVDLPPAATSKEVDAGVSEPLLLLLP